MSIGTHAHFNAVNVAIDDVVGKFPTYDAYLDSRVDKRDLFFLEDEETARRLYELGFPGKGEHISREEFDERKRQVELAKQTKEPDPTDLSSADCDLSHSPFLRCLAEKEEGNREGYESTIIFLRGLNELGQEVSAYIDYADRLQKEDFKQYFQGKKVLLPKPTDLSYFNWNTNAQRLNSSVNYEVMSSSSDGLQFRHKQDRRFINVDPKVKDPGLGTMRVVIATDEYLQVTIYEHNPHRTL
ncbi:cilia- and flagella-associated protein 299-like [Sycon ciliatum]|uniref:cilia- and flagella-associated protein 299-like n=1 Tax=Sycon ciliatum TaxID=27933 RepID=UPI0020A9AEC9|eukprot:scpid85527/ scgid35312/ Uncharacterized protein C4orf22